MPTVAEQLRGAREAMKLDVHHVAEITKIRTDHIRALEAGDYDQFVAPVYIRGFVRTYANLLKLDLPKIMADLNAELGATEKFAEPPSLTKQPKSSVDTLMLYLSRVDWRILLGVLSVTIIATLAVVGYRIYYDFDHKTKDPLKSLVPGMRPTPTEMGENTLPLPGPAKR